MLQYAAGFPPRPFGHEATKNISSVSTFPIVTTVYQTGFVGCPIFLHWTAPQTQASLDEEPWLAAAGPGAEHPHDCVVARPIMVDIAPGARSPKISQIPNLRKMCRMSDFLIWEKCAKK